MPSRTELLDVVDRCARVPRGLAFAHRAPVEAVAAALQVHPDAVEEVRAALSRQPDRRELIAAFVHARQAAPVPEAEPAAVSPGRGPERLAQDAAAGELGTQFLLHAPLEVAAVMFRVHPDVVAAARRLVSGEGAGQEPRWAPLLSGAVPGASRATRQG